MTDPTTVNVDFSEWETTEDIANDLRTAIGREFLGRLNTAALRAQMRTYVTSWLTTCLERGEKIRLIEPEFKHDCTGCTFLGRFEGRDLYHCGRHAMGVTLIARWSDDGPDYISGMVFAAEYKHLDGTMRPGNSWLVEARRRALGKGLNCDE